MGTIKKILIYLLILLVLAVAATLVMVNRISRRALPDYDENIEIDGLQAEVEVIRDQWAIPHVYAKNEHDLFVSAGYLMAQDRLWQMDLIRRVTTGRLSEIFGKDYAEADMLFRSLRMQEKSRRILENASPEMVDILEAFAYGINQYIGDHENQLPFEFFVLGYRPDPWEPVHSVNIIGYMVWSLSSSWINEVNLFKITRKAGLDKALELLPDLASHEPVMTGAEAPGYTEGLSRHLTEPVAMVYELGLRIFSGSNNWAVSGERTQSGKPILANDMHLGIDDAPGIWYQIHEVVPGKLNVSGVALPGTPFIVCGHNEHIAWGMTNVMLDDIDFYIETVNPGDTSQYMVDGTWCDMTLVHEKIHTREGDTLRRINRFTHRGPVVSGFRDIPDRIVSMRWTGNEHSNEIRSVYLLNRARNWQDFLDAVRTFTSGAQNIVYADVEGNIGLRTCACIPLRPGNRAFFAPGDTSLYDWTGMVPFSEMPCVYNPEEGFVSSANNRTAGPEYPHYISSWFDLPNRMERIRELIGEDRSFTLEDMQNIQTDQKSKWAEKLVPVFTIELNRGKPSGIYRDALGILEKWDFVYSPESAAALIFERTYLHLAENITMDELGPDLYKEFISQDLMFSYLMDRIRRQGDSEWCDDVNTREIRETFGDMLRKSFHEAIDRISQTAGEDIRKWKWGDFHQLTLRHALSNVNILDRAFRLSRGSWPVGGSYHTVCPFSYSFNDPFSANHGASQRHLYSTDNWDRSLTVIPTGISGIPASNHFCDQSATYILKKYHKAPFSRESVTSRSKYRMFFIPAER